MDPRLGMLGGAIGPGRQSFEFRIECIIGRTVSCGSLPAFSSRPRQPMTELISSSSSDPLEGTNTCCSGVEQQVDDSGSDPEQDASCIGKRDARSIIFFTVVGVTRPKRITSTLFRLRAFNSPSGHKWQCPQFSAFLHPVAFQNQAHGRQFPDSCKAEPWLGVPGGAASPGGKSGADWLGVAGAG